MPQEMKDKISKTNKGKCAWNKGLTKETDKRLDYERPTKFGNIPAWNKGLNKKTDKRLDYERPTSFKKGNIPPFKNKKMSKESKEKMRLGKLGKRLEETNNWRGGLSFESYPLEFNNDLKIKIRERDGYICQICEKYGKCVHHIDYNKNNCSEENLITLCPRCHLITNGKRQYWEMKLKIFMKNNLLYEVTENGK